MGCFFGCFRVTDNSTRSRPHLVSNPARFKSTEPVAPRNRLSTLFLSEERENSPRDDPENPCLRSPQIDKHLKDEAKFLKACGTLPETPVEIRKASEKLKGSPTSYKYSEPSKFNSWLPNTSMKKLQLDKHSDQPPTPLKLCEEWGNVADSSEHTPSSCISNSHSTGASEARSAKPVNVEAKQTENVTTPWPSATNAWFANKSVRFDCDFDASSSKGSSSENFSQNSKRFESPGNLSVSKPLPNPTPLKLSDEMQTPGTVFPANLETVANGNNRIRSQYVYTALNPVENVSQWKVLKEEGSNSLSGDLKESHEQSENSTPMSEVQSKDSSAGKHLTVEASLSSWLKPPLSSHDDNNQNIEAASTKKPYFGRTPGDRPIIGMVAAHWNENEPSHISPKWWDGNGIPNSTNKYKEDQKVSWHATPFEERLEKALSEESSIIQRKHVGGKPVVFDELDESDTALSQLQPSAHSKSVVSF